MKLLFASDIHIHEFEDFSTILPNGENSRLFDILNGTFQALTKCVKKHKPDAIIFGGDTFHTPRAVLTRVFQRAYEAAEVFAEGLTVPWVINAGNHDLPSLAVNSKVTSIYAFKRFAELVVGGVRTFNIGDQVSVHVVPYMQDSRELLTAVQRIRVGKNRRNLLVLHCGIAEAVVGPNEVRLDAPLMLKDLRLDEFDFVLAGHYHKPQRIHPKVAVIGAPVQHNMLDRGEERGLALYDTETNDIERIILPGPHFHLYEVADEVGLKAVREEASELGGGYVRVLLRTERLRSAVENLLAVAEPRAFEVKFVKQLESQARSTELTSQLIASGGSLTNAVESFIEHVNPNSLKRKLLTKIGRKLLDEEIGA